MNPLSSPLTPSPNRPNTLLAVFAVALTALQVGAAEDSPAPTPKPAETKPAEAPEKSTRKEQDPLVQLIRALTPEQKARLMENIRAWQQLAPDIKQALRARDKALRKVVADEVQAALEGTQLTQEQRELFEQRYREERRKLEATLKTEMEARRKAALEEMIARLKQSVSTPAAEKSGPR